MNQEKLSITPEANVDALRELGQKQGEVLRQKHEQIGELSRETNEQTSERARLEAMENAISVEKKIVSKEKSHAPATRRGAISKRELDTTYKRTLDKVQSELSTPSRAFSKVIHTKAVERTSEALEKTVARPNAMLAGAIGAFVATLAVYLISKYFGYQLSGFETIGGFVLGWIAGLLFDYFKVMITGKHS
jgi:hypothetical protein